MTRDVYDRFQAPERGRFGDNEQQQGVHARLDQRDRVARPARATKGAEIIDLMVAIHHGTPKALLVSLDGENGKAKWLPRELLEVEHGGAVVLGTDRHGRQVQLATAVVTLPRWLAEQKGLL
jgi:hypothetical protein